ncbi:MAG: MFS transporter [Deltaproteobacteria bacterium]|nr:MFS transporter [Deltaproteobacteria bacterium]
MIIAPKKSEAYRWIILVVVYLSILAFTFIFQSIPPILPLIISELHINYAQSGLLMSLFALPGIFLSLPGGFLSDRYDVKVLGAVCFLWMIGGTLLIGLGTDIHILWLGRIIAGMGALTLSVLLPKLLSQWFKDGELGLAMGVFNTGVPLGSAISFGLFGRLGNLWGWRIPILLTGIYSLIIAILFCTFYRRPHFQRMENGKSPNLYQSLKEMGLPIWGVGLSWLWFNAAFVSFATFAPNLFLQKDYTIEQSGLLIGIPLLGSLLFSAPIGYLVDRFKHQEWFVGIGAFALAFLTLFFNFNFSFLLLVIMMGVFSALIPAPIYSLPPEILKIETVGLGFGVISTCSSIGLLGAPYFVGMVRDLTGADHWSFILISLFFLLTGVSILLPRRFPSIRSSEVKG